MDHWKCVPVESELYGGKFEVRDINVPERP